MIDQKHGADDQIENLACLICPALKENRSFRWGCVLLALATVTGAISIVLLGVHWLSGVWGLLCLVIWCAALWRLASGARMLPNGARGKLRNLIDKCGEFVVFLVSVVFYGVGVFAFLRWQVEAVQHPLLTPILIATVPFMASLWLWAVYRSGMPRVESTIEIKIQNIWFWILLVGLYGVLFHFAFVVLPSKANPGTELEQLVALFLHTKTGEVFSLIMASLLADFAVHFLSEFRKSHDLLENYAKKAESAAAAARQASERMQEDAGVLKASQVGFESSLAKVSADLKKVEATTTTALSQAERTVAGFSLMVENAAESDQAERDLLDWVRKLPDGPVRDAMFRVYGGKGLPEEYKGVLPTLRDRVRLVLSAYKTARTPYVPTLIASKFIAHIVGEWGRNAVDSDPVKGGVKLQDSVVQTNYGVMAGIVDELYQAAGEIHSNVIPKDKRKTQRLVFFTTLTMPIPTYFDFANNVGPAARSITRQWDAARLRTRNCVYQRSHTPDVGHMWRFREHVGELEFRRSCLWLADGDVPQGREHQTGALRRKSEWSACGPAATLGSAQAHVWEAKLEGHHVVNDVSSHFEVDMTQLMSGGWGESEAQGWAAAKALVDKMPENWDHLDLSPAESLPTQLGATYLDAFKRLYHPFPENCWFYELNRVALAGTFFAMSTEELKAMFPDDETWSSLVVSMKSDVQQAVKPVVTLASGKELFWYDIFFNRHIPVDIFAIGVLDTSMPSGAVKWLGGLGAYVDSDLARIDLAWMDETIAPERWQAVTRFLNVLYSGSTELTKESLSSPTKVLKDVEKTMRPPSNRHQMDGALTTVFRRYAFGVGPSAVVRDVTVLMQQLKPRLRILDAGGAYGRDARVLAKQRISDVIVVDNDSHHQSTLNALFCNDTGLVVSDFEAPLVIEGASRVAFLVGSVADDRLSYEIEAKLKVAAGELDIVYSNHLLHLLSSEQLLTTFKNFHRLLRPGGCMVHRFLSDNCWSVVGKEGPHITPDGKEVEFCGHSDNTLRDAAKSCGFDVDDGFELTRELCVELHLQRKTREDEGEAAFHSHVVWHMKCVKKN